MNVIRTGGGASPEARWRSVRNRFVPAPSSSGSQFVNPTASTPGIAATRSANS